jgi:hypothetical protein
MVPVVRVHDGERELIQMRWGFPPPPKIGTQPVTNARNVSSPFWRAWLKPQYRCLVPLTSFSEFIWTALARLWPFLAGDVGAQGGEANDAVAWQRFRQETPPCRICPPASPRSL